MASDKGGVASGRTGGGRVAGYRQVGTDQFNRALYLPRGARDATNPATYRAGDRVFTGGRSETPTLQIDRVNRTTVAGTTSFGAAARVSMDSVSMIDRRGQRIPVAVPRLAQNIRQ